MKREALEITHELSKQIMERKDCKISRVAVEPVGDPNISGKTRVTFVFHIYDKEEDCKKA